MLGARGAALLGVALCLSRCSLSDFDSLSAGLALNNGSPGGGAAGASFQPDASSQNNSGSGGEGGSAGQASGGSAGSSPDAGGGGNEPDAASNAPENLIGDPGFEQGSPRWISVGNVILSISTDNPRSGNSSLFVSGRDDFVYEGPGYELFGDLEPGTTYSTTVWVRLVSDAQTARLMFKHKCTGETDTEANAYFPVASVRSDVDDGLGWYELSGTFTARSCESVSMILYIEGPAVGEDFFIDDASVYRTSP